MSAIRSLGRWFRRPLAILVAAAVASALCGFCLHPQGFVVAIGLSAMIGSGLIWPWLIVRGVRGSVGFDRDRGREGEPSTVRLVVRNRLPWGAWGLEVRAGLGDRPGQVDAGLSVVPGWRSVDQSWEFVPDRRGTFPSGHASVGSGFPFGLISWTRKLEARNRLMVWPRTFDVGPIPLAATGTRPEGPVTRRRGGGTGEVLGVRPYRRGDSLRRVHWPQTARTGQLVVCESESTASPTVQVVVDVDPSRHAGIGSRGSREWAIRVAASFVETWLGQGAEVELVVEGRLVAPRGGSLAMRRAILLDAIARISEADSSSLADLLDLPGCRSFRGGMRIVVATDLASDQLVGRRSSCTERLVLLHAAAFEVGQAGGRSENEVPRSIAWAWVDDPARIESQVRRMTARGA